MVGGKLPVSPESVTKYLVSLASAPSGRVQLKPVKV